MKKTILDCGLTILTEKYATIPSFALSYTIKSGSCNETVKDNGIHHLIEHMLFKGSDKYSQKDIADISDRLGGRMNAFTSREITQYYIKSIDEKLGESFDLLSDIVFSSAFDNNEFKKEVEVIKQEIKESSDNPDSCTFEMFYNDVFGNSGIGLPIAGTVESVSGLERDQVYQYYKDLYHPSNAILSCTGNIEHDIVVSLAEKWFSGFVKKTGLQKDKKEIKFRTGILPHPKKDLQQLYSIIGFRSIPVISPDRFKYMIMNDILGSGMSSRLFQKIREEKGLAYTIASFIDSYMDFGVHIIYAVTDPGKKEDYLNAIKEEFRSLKEDGISEEELKKSKDHIKTSLILSLESNVSKMRFNINGELYFKKPKKIKDIINEINIVTVDDINKILTDYPDPGNISTLLYGNFAEDNHIF
ncbi:MAG: pitrilysin family protein [Acidobacteriota bacterium]